MIVITAKYCFQIGQLIIESCMIENDMFFHAMFIQLVKDILWIDFRIITDIVKVSS